MAGDLAGQALSGDAEGGAPEAVPATLSVAVHRRLLALLREFKDAMASIEEVVTVLEAVTGDPPARPRPGGAPFTGVSNQAAPSTDVTLEVSMDDPAFIDDLQEALAEIPGVQRVRLSATGDRSASVTVTLEAAPTPTESLLTFRDALAETAGVGRVLLTEFGDDHATFAITAASAGPEATATEAPSVVCAWCGRLLTLGGSMVSHGICPACAARTTAGASRTASPPPPPTTDAPV